jgi:hypothetical protein
MLGEEISVFPGLDRFRFVAGRRTIMFAVNETTSPLSLPLPFFPLNPLAFFSHVTRLLTYAWKVISLARPYNIR